MKARSFLYFFSGFFLCTTTYATEYANLKHIAAQSEQYLKEQLYKELPNEDYNHVKIKTRPLDSRLKLLKCDNSLTFKKRPTARTNRNISIKASCHQESGWAVYIKHSISLEKKIITLASSLPKHHVISASDVAYMSRDIYQLRNGYVGDASMVIGQQLKRSLKQGDILYHYHLQAPDIIRKGDRVNVIARIGKLSVITRGVALSDGRKGEQIDIENRRSSRIIRARILGSESVEVIL